MRRKLLYVVATLLCLTMAVSGVALAAWVEDDIVCLGGDLNAEQVLQVEDYLDVDLDDVEIIYVSIDEERDMLGDYVSAERIGSRSISSARVQLRGEGRGITVSTHNITWVTSKMYAQALTTAGVTDARITVAAPFEVSGTAALTGILKAYEGLAGETLGDEAKDVASEELVLTGSIADFVGNSDDAADLISQVKEEVVELGLTSAEEILPIIEDISRQNGINLDAEHRDSVVDLMMDIGGLDTIDVGGELDSLYDGMTKLGDVEEVAGGALGAIGDFFSGIVDWFTALVG